MGNASNLQEMRHSPGVILRCDDPSLRRSRFIESLCLLFRSLMDGFGMRRVCRLRQFLGSSCFLQEVLSCTSDRIAHVQIHFFLEFAAVLGRRDCYLHSILSAFACPRSRESHTCRISVAGSNARWGGRFRFQSPQQNSDDDRALARAVHWTEPRDGCILQSSLVAGATL
jgi:hypothetical protein